MGFNITEHIQSIIYLLYLGIILVALGIINIKVGKNSFSSLLLLAFGSFAISQFVNLGNPFLHMWDEQVHAVVAKNMLHNPFKPMLIPDPVLPIDFKNWTGNHIWVHKQPLFLWQIALSYKLFGINLFALRFPSMLMFSLMVFPVYRIGRIISTKETGIYAAAFLIGSNFIYQLVGGRMNTDHNDVAFLFYITLSIWAWFERENSGKRYWIVLIGIFSGAAILNKWLVGLLVYSVWGLNILIFRKKRRDLISWAEMLVSFLITLVVFLPWQIYILKNFPVESRYEFNYNSLHFFQSMEGHSGDMLYHFNKIETLYGTDFQYVIIASIIIFLISKIKPGHKLGMLTPILVVYFFFSMAATKMPAFPIIISPLVYIIVAVSVTTIIKWLMAKNRVLSKNKILGPFIGTAIALYIFFHFLNHDYLCLKNSDLNRRISQKAVTLTEVYKDLPLIIGDKKTMVYNARNFDKLKIMFYTDYMARSGFPSKQDIKSLKEKNIGIFVFDNDKLPDYIIKDSTIAKIKSAVWQKNHEGQPKVYY